MDDDPKFSSGNLGKIIWVIESFNPLYGSSNIVALCTSEEEVKKRIALWNNNKKALFTIRSFETDIEIPSVEKSYKQFQIVYDAVGDIPFNMKLSSITTDISPNLSTFTTNTIIDKDLDPLVGWIIIHLWHKSSKEALKESNSIVERILLEERLKLK